MLCLSVPVLTTFFSKQEVRKPRRCADDVVGVQTYGQGFGHRAWTLLELDTRSLECSARRIYILDVEGDVTKASHYTLAVQWRAFRNIGAL